MTPPIEAAQAALPACARAAPRAAATPHYLAQVYWWAYVHPKAVRVFEREWLVNLILFGNYGRLRDAAIADLGQPIGGRTLQVACVYGNLTARLQQRLSPDASLDVVDILAIQLRNLARKLAPDPRVRLLQRDSSSLAAADAHYDQVLMFFLLHEQPDPVRRATLAEALRVLKPGGRLVIVDYHRPLPLHPLRPLMSGVFRRLEPFAMDLWRHEISDFFPADRAPLAIEKTTFYGGLYQKLAVTR